MSSGVANRASEDAVDDVVVAVGGAGLIHSPFRF